DSRVVDAAAARGSPPSSTSGSGAVRRAGGRCSPPVPLPTVLRQGYDVSGVRRKPSERTTLPPLTDLLQRLSIRRKPVRVLIVDDDVAFARSLSAYLADEARIEVIGVAEDGGEAIDLALIHHPDVVLMDERMPLVGGSEATAHLSAIRSTSRVVMMSGDSSGGTSAAAAGA